MTMNLVLIPLEGVSQTLFWQYRGAMPTLWKMSNEAIMFRRFYSASTSAFQSFCDVAYGDSSQLDHNLAFPSARGCLLESERNFFAILNEKGYATLGIQHGESRPAYVKDNYFGAWPDVCGEFRWHGEYDPFFAETFAFMEKARAAGKPFALYYADRASTVADNCPEKQEARLYHQRFEKGYSLLDGSVARLMQKLGEMSILDDTIIVAFGPYGMDPWKHGVFRGRVHALDPYADMCWTPLFIFNNSRNPQIVDPLACTTDLKASVLDLLFTNPKLGLGKGQFTGVNFLSRPRDIVFTQNLFALERENEGPALGIAKSYAATDGDQRLIVSSNGGIPGEGGMEFFYDPRDSTNSRNLLDFFELSVDGKIVRFGNPNATHSHFLYAFRPDNPKLLINSIMESYNTMRAILKRLVKSKEDSALPHCGSQKEAKRFDESRFNVKRRKM